MTVTDLSDVLPCSLVTMEIGKNVGGSVENRGNLPVDFSLLWSGLCSWRRDERGREGERGEMILNANSIAVNSIQVDTQNIHNMATPSLTKRTQCFAAAYTQDKE